MLEKCQKSLKNVREKKVRKMFEKSLKNVRKKVEKCLYVCVRLRAADRDPLQRC